MTGFRLHPRFSITVTDWVDSDGNHGAYAVAMRTRVFTHDKEYDEIDYWFDDPLRLTPERTQDTIEIEGRDARSIWVKDISMLGDAIAEMWADLFAQTHNQPYESQREVTDGRRALGSGTA